MFETRFRLAGLVRRGREQRFAFQPVQLRLLETVIIRLDRPQPSSSNVSSASLNRPIRV